MVFALVLFKQCGTPPAQKAGSQPSADQLYAKLVDENHKLQEASAASTYGDYKTALNDEISAQQDIIKNSKSTAEQKQAAGTKEKELQGSLEKKEIEGAILVADAQLRGGRVTHEYNKYWLAFNTLQDYERHQASNPAWTQDEVKVENRKGQVTYWTGQKLYAQVSKELSYQNRTTLVYGFLPGWQIFDFLVGMTGKVPGFSYWFCTLFLAVLVRGLVWPLTQKQIKYGRQMQQLLPRIKEIKAAYPKDSATQQKETMAVYKEYGINPMMGCIPLVIQTPFFIAIYDCMLRYRFEFQHGTFLWVNPVTSAATHGFIAPNLGQQDTILLILYTLTMLSSQLLMPVSDPTNAKSQRIMGVVMSIAIPGTMLLGFYVLPSAFVLYWTFTNIIATIQALLAYRQPVPPLERVLTADGGLIPGRKQSFWEKMQGDLERKFSEAKGEKAPAKPQPKKRGGFYDRIQEEARKQLDAGSEENDANAKGSQKPGQSKNKDSQNGGGQSNGQGHSNGKSGQKKAKRRT